MYGLEVRTNAVRDAPVVSRRMEPARTRTD